ncbi:MAG: hypothetical protein RL380_1015 [Verrucomicrobiota bacterium]|jgi:hypothetical protein
MNKVFPQRLGKNHGGYFGETIDVRAVLRELELVACKHGWTTETFGLNGDWPLRALSRKAESRKQKTESLYVSAGIHGDEPAAPLAMLQLVQENIWPDADIFLCPCLNPGGFAANRRENRQGIDLNRDYRHLRSAEIAAHVAWLEQQPKFDRAFCLHEDWEANGFYVYELNPDGHASLAEKVVAAVKEVCPLDLAAVIEGREAHGGIIRPNLDPATRPEWPEAFWLIQNKTRRSCTLEAPSDFLLAPRVDALVAGVRAAWCG